jgi:hypothetical protein
MKLVHGFTAAVLAVGHFFQLRSFESVEIIEFEAAVTDGAVSKRVLKLFSTSDILQLIEKFNPEW